MKTHFNYELFYTAYTEAEDRDDQDEMDRLIKWAVDTCPWEDKVRIWYEILGRRLVSETEQHLSEGA